jgi:uncharacterized protein (DUF433 family)
MQRQYPAVFLSGVIAMHASRITIEPGKRGGRPSIRGLRITVYDILVMLSNGMSETEILDDFPELETEDIRAALAYAATREHQVIALSAS